MSPLFAAQIAVDIVVTHGVHHSGKNYQDGRDIDIIKSASGELIELAEQIADGAEALLVRDELADVFIALFHLKRRLEISDTNLAKSIIYKLLARNQLHEAHVEAIKKLMEGVEADVG